MGMPVPPTPAREQQLRELDLFFDRLEEATPRRFVAFFLLIICVGMYGFLLLQRVNWWMPNPRQLLAWGANHVALSTGTQPWRYLTHIVLHSGLLHLLVNAWGLRNIGPFAEALFGNLPFALIFILSGIGGGIGSNWLNPGPISVGASGAILGIFGAVLGFVVVRRHCVPQLLLREIGISVVFFVVLNAIIALLVPNIDHGAHLGGLATGFVCGLLMSRPIPVLRVPLPFIVTCLRYAAALLVAWALFVCNSFAREHYQDLQAKREARLRQDRSRRKVRVRAHADPILAPPVFASTRIDHYSLAQSPESVKRWRLPALSIVRLPLHYCSNGPPVNKVYS